MATLRGFILWWQAQATLNRKLDAIMAAIDDLNAKVDALQVSLDQEQEQIKDAIDALNQSIKDLEAIIASGGGGTSDAEIQAVIAKLDATQKDLEGTIAEPPVVNPETQPSDAEASSKSKGK